MHNGLVAKKKNRPYFPQKTYLKQNDPLQTTAAKVRKTLITKILDQRKSELDKLSIKHKDSTTTDMKQLRESNKVVLIFALRRSTTPNTAKIHQMLSGIKHHTEVKTAASVLV
jgi:hypothetical protein